MSSLVTTAEPVLLINEFLKLDRELAGVCQPVRRSTISDLSAYARGEGRHTRVVVTAGGSPMEEAVWDFPELALIAVLSVGYDGIDIARARARGVQVTTGAGANADDVADMAIGLLIAAVREIGRGDRLVRAGRWDKPIVLPATRSITTLRYGIVGLGAIGSAIARRLDHGFGAKVSWWGPRAKPEAAWPRADSLVELAEASDVLIVAAPANRENDRLIDARVLEALGSQGYLVNIARGSLLDEDALLAALRSGALAGAGLDVFEREPHDGVRWKDIETVALMPHNAGGSERAIAEIRRLGIANVTAFLKGDPLLTPLF